MQRCVARLPPAGDGGVKIAFTLRDHVFQFSQQGGHVLQITELSSVAKPAHQSDGATAGPAATGTGPLHHNYLITRDPPTVYNIRLPREVVAEASSKLVLVPETDFCSAQSTQWRVWYQQQEAGEGSSEGVGTGAGGADGAADAGASLLPTQLPSRGADLTSVGASLVLNVGAEHAGKHLVCECTGVKDDVAGECFIRATPIVQHAAPHRPWLAMRAMQPASGAAPCVGAGDRAAATGYHDGKAAAADADLFSADNQGTSDSGEAAAAFLMGYQAVAGAGAGTGAGVAAAGLSSLTAAPLSAVTTSSGSAAPTTATPDDTVGATVARTAPACAPSPSGSADADFTVMSYNMLADMYVSRPGAHEELYPYCDPQFLRRNYRKQMLLGEMLEYGADIMCCQEVENGGFAYFYEPSLRAVGYEGVHSPKGNARHGQTGEGCATFYKTDRFRMISTTTVSFADAVDDGEHADIFAPYLASEENAAAFRRVNSIGQMTLLAEVGAGAGVGTGLASTTPAATKSSSGGGGDGEAGDDPGDDSGDVSQSASRAVLVLNTHLYYHPAAPHIRSLQLAVLLRSAANQLAARPGTSLLLCGDLNSTPETGVVEFLWKGALAPSHPEWQHGFKFRWDASRGGNVGSIVTPDTVNIEPVTDGGQRRGNLPVQWASPPPLPSASQHGPTTPHHQAHHQDHPDHPDQQTGPTLTHPFDFTMPHSLDEMTGNSSTYTKEFCGWIDYIAASNGITVTQSLPPLPEMALSWGGTSFLPSAYFPSDHVPVVATCAWDADGR